MSLLSLFRKKTQDSSPNEGNFQSRSEEASAELRNPGNRTKRKSSRQSTEPVDPMLPEKKRARRRLVGAVALVLAAIIGLPMILDAEQKPLGDDVVIQIPSKDQVAPTSMATGHATRVAAATALDPTEEVMITAPLPKVDAAVSAPSEPATVVAKPPPAPREEPATAAPIATPEVRSVPKKEAVLLHKNSTRVVDETARQPDSVRAQSILDGGSVVAKLDKKSTKVIVQVAALASKEKVDELRDKLKAAGIASYTQIVATESGQRIRVRIGPFGSKEEADAARGKLTRLGLNGSLVPS